MFTYELGDRVVCMNDSSYNGATGTIVQRYNTYGTPLYRIQWDGFPGQALDHPENHGGTWDEEAITDSDEEDEIEEMLKLKNTALAVAAFVFGQYAQMHPAKGTDEGTMKGLTNVGLERMMLNALEAY